MQINDNDSPMEVVHKLTVFLDDLIEDQVKAQILEIYLEDNPDVRSILLHNLGLF